MARRYPESNMRNAVLTAILVLIPTVVGTFVDNLGGFQGTLWYVFLSGKGGKVTAGLALVAVVL